MRAEGREGEGGRVNVLMLNGELWEKDVSRWNFCVKKLGYFTIVRRREGVRYLFD